MTLSPLSYAIKEGPKHERAAENDQLHAAATTRRFGRQNARYG
jgi:hypothetical protein